MKKKITTNPATAKHNSLPEKSVLTVDAKSVQTVLKKSTIKEPMHSQPILKSLEFINSDTAGKESEPTQSLITESTQKIEEAIISSLSKNVSSLNKNISSSSEHDPKSLQNIKPNIMIGKRVYVRTFRDNPELLALLSNNLVNSGYPQIWGHIFKCPDRGIYISSIINLNVQFNPLNVTSLFNYFWYYIKEAGCWYPAEKEACALSIDFKQAARELCRLIKLANLNLDLDDDAEKDIRLVSLYPFPNVFKKTRSFGKWLEEEESNA